MSLIAWREYRACVYACFLAACSDLRAAMRVKSADVDLVDDLGVELAHASLALGLAEGRA